MIVTFLGTDNDDYNKLTSGNDYFVVECFVNSYNELTYTIVNDEGEITNCYDCHFVIKENSVDKRVATERNWDVFFEFRDLQGIDKSYIPNQEKIFNLLKSHAQRFEFNLSYLKGWKSSIANENDRDKVALESLVEFGMTLGFELVKNANLTWTEIAVGLDCGLLADNVAIQYAIQALLNGEKAEHICEIAGLTGRPNDIAVFPYLRNWIDWQLVNYYEIKERLLSFFLIELYNQRKKYQNIEDILYQLNQNMGYSRILSPIASGGFRYYYTRDFEKRPILKLWHDYLENEIWHEPRQVLYELERILLSTAEPSEKSKLVKKFVYSKDFQNFKYSQTFMAGLNQILHGVKVSLSAKDQYYESTSKKLKHEYAQTIKDGFYHNYDKSQNDKLNTQLTTSFSYIRVKTRVRNLLKNQDIPGIQKERTFLTVEQKAKFFGVVCAIIAVLLVVILIMNFLVASDLLLAYGPPSPLERLGAGLMILGSGLLLFSGAIVKIIVSVKNNLKNRS